MAEQIVLKELQTVEDQQWSGGKGRSNGHKQLWPGHSSPAPLVASLKGLSVACSNNEREKMSLKSSLGKQEGYVSCFP